MNLNRRTLVFAVPAFAAITNGWAQPGFPDRPIRIVVVTAAGSASDTLTRRLCERVGKLLGQPFIVENRPGANGLIAARQVAKSSNDGYTLMVGGVSTHASPAYMFKEVGYDPVQDFTAITNLTFNPLVLVVNADRPMRSTREFIQYARQQPGKLSYGTGNAGGLVATHLLTKLAGIDAVGVNYKGTAQAAADLAAGQLDFMVVDPVVALPFVQSGRLRVLGVTSSQPLPLFPDAAPLGQADLPGYAYASWIGLFGPADMPDGATRRIHQAFSAALTNPAIEGFIHGIGMLAARPPQPAFGEFVQDQIKLWGQLSKDAGISPP